MAAHFADFARDLRPADVPERVRVILRRSLADTLGVAAVGSTTEISRITREAAARHWRGDPDAGEARMLFDGRRASAAGAAMAGASMVDAIDGHDGHSGCKGHAGSAVFPALLAVADALAARGRGPDGEALLCAVAAAYEVAYRSGLTQHGTTADYHTSGAWDAVGVAAGAGRLLGLDREGIRQAAGIAEYHGPRSQMMRCIDHPTMVRDGVTWGAPTGVMSAHLAALGFTGAPAVTAEGEAAMRWWGDLGERWEIENTHYKRYPVCRWAHPAIDAAAELMAAHGLAAADVERVRIRTFHEATRLAGHAPANLDELSYSIAFPVALMIVRGRIGVEELTPAALSDPEVLRVSRATRVEETEEYNRISVGVRWADVTLYTADGQALESPPRKPRGDPDDPLSPDELDDKYRRFAVPVLGEARAAALAERALAFDALDADGVAGMLDLALAAAG